MKAVILAGGSGTRLWPISRESKPKQFHSFISDRTMLAETVDRVDFLPINDVFIATTAQYEKEVRKQIPNLPAENLIVEPALRDTGPCICHSALTIQRIDPDAVMAVIYADHLIQNKNEFMKKLQAAEKLAREDDTLNIIEVKAKVPNPNLGYVKTGKLVKEFEDGTEVFELDHFVEKPDYETAKKFLFSSHRKPPEARRAKGGRFRDLYEKKPREAGHTYLWNTGIYVWKVSTILKQYKKHAPQIFSAVSSGNYEKAPKISIDYAIMEKTDPKKVRIIPADLGWSDIGNWASLHEETAPDESENLIQGDHIGIGTKGSVIYGKKGKMIATIGMENFVIVDTDDALLVCPKDKAGEVKKVVEELKKQNKSNLL